jgi:anthranilate phosphoribosyltransferase
MIETHKSFLLNLFEGHLSDEEIKGWLIDLQKRGETSEELAGFAAAMREKMIPVPLSPSAPLLDLCGTGGTGKQRFNISTTAAFVLASAGINVAKHGNYGSKKPNGSFNFTECLGLKSLSDGDAIKKIYEETNLAFLFARFFHPAMKRVASIRQSLACRTVFNSLGPLCNPASPTHQVLGTSDVSLAKKLAEAVHLLGTEGTLIAVGGDGSDELSVTGENKLFVVTPSSIETKSLVADFVKNKSLYICGDAEENASLFKSVFSKGDSDHAVSHHVALNAGAAFWIVGNVSTIEDGYQKALELIKDKTVYFHFEMYKALIN